MKSSLHDDHLRAVYLINTGLAHKSHYFIELEKHDEVPELLYNLLSVCDNGETRASEEKLTKSI